jgi:uncharacterized RDD family membrane protein YckC
LIRLNNAIAKANRIYMNLNINSFIEHYQTLTDDELIHIKANMDLTEDAKYALSKVFQQRGINSTKEIEEIIEDTFVKSKYDEKYASRGVRWFANFIDSLIEYALLFPILITNSIIHLIYFSLIAYILYFLFKDALFNGQSIGKKMLGINVVNKTDETYCDLKSSFLRNITLLLTIIDAIFILGVGKQRLGDRLANTIVVKSTYLKSKLLKEN